jgi:hypothetical protein
MESKRELKVSVAAFKKYLKLCGMSYKRLYLNQKKENTKNKKDQREGN